MSSPSSQEIRADTPEYGFFLEVVRAVAEDRIELPTLPDVALRVAQACAGADVSIPLLAGEVSRDPAIAASVLRVANSAALGGSKPVGTLQQAIVRLGLAKTQMLVTAMAAGQLYASPAPLLTRRLRRSWANSIEVAALARTVARRFTRLDADQAMLAGLMHEVGILPIISAASRDARVRDNAAAVEKLVGRLHATVGRRLLTNWNFPPELADVPEACTAFARSFDGPADYADVVCVALLHERPLREARYADVERSGVTAYGRLDMDAQAGIPLVDDFDKEFQENRALLAA